MMRHLMETNRQVKAKEQKFAEVIIVRRHQHSFLYTCTCTRSLYVTGSREYVGNNTMIVFWLHVLTHVMIEHAEVLRADADTVL